MIRRLVEAHFFQNISRPNRAQIRFWLLELRTPELLIELGRVHTRLCLSLATFRPLLTGVLRGNRKKLEQGLLAEEYTERELDRQYWLPLRKELEQLRHPAELPST